ncbi:MAG: SAM-dependent methyltransferase, partial [Defluviitaleaceae bacterium]|nr:SAM-dependent methyltransferase [Defluviitaleaceae bacterium]
MQWKVEYEAEQTRQPPAAAQAAAVEITQDDIDAALINSKGDVPHKLHICEYMRAHGRERAAADFLKEELKHIAPDMADGNAVYLPDGLTVYKGDYDHPDAKTVLSWPKVQRRIVQLMDAGQYLTEAEQAAYVNKPTPEIVPEQHGAVPVGRLDFLDVDGTVAESLEFTDAQQFVAKIREEDNAGAPFSIVIYRDDNGNLVDANSFIEDINPTTRLTTEPLPALKKDEHLPPNSHIETIDGVDFVFTTVTPTHEMVKEPEVEPEYVLDYRYVNDRLLVFNNANYDPDELAPIIARVEPDGSLVYLDEKLPDEIRDEIRRVAENDLETYKTASEAHLQDMIDHAAKVGDFSEARIPPVNFRITDDDLGVGGAKTRYNRNVDAIRALKAIEAEKRTATPDEQISLSQFTGWGAISQAFDPEHKDWQKEYPELKELLTPDEYRAAQRSTLNAHYTSPVVIKVIYDALGGMGFETGNILEPACGTGNFFGLLPDSMAKSKLYGVELDSITGRIAKQLYPNANITVSGFEKTAFPNDFFDVVVGNVPFGGYGVADPEYDRLKFNIHDYFLAKSFDKVRPGGIVAVITSNGTMDKQDQTVRKYLAQRGELLGAVRLPC